MDNTNLFPSLTQAEADHLLKKNGFNELPSQKKQSAFLFLLKVLSEPMLLLLLVIGIIYYFMGELQDTLMLLGAVFIVIGITYYQGRKTEKTLQALRDLSSPRALVIRNGKQKRIAGREVVVGDIIVIREGDRIPADSTILSCENLTLDESLLTGESMPVRKMEGSEKSKFERPGGDDLPFVYSGCLVTSGRGVCKVNYTGLETEIGKIGKSLDTIVEEDTLLHKETTKIVRVVGGVGLILCVLVVALYVFMKGDLTGGFLAGLTLSMAILPEEFPIVLIIFMTLGAWRISKRRVLTRRPATIETLGAATVLCTDKTGTLTLNKMELSSLYSAGSFYELSDDASADLPEQFKVLLGCGVLASQKDPFDPIETELNKVGAVYLKGKENPTVGWELIKEYPLSKKLLALSHVWQSKDLRDLHIAAKGAPESILDLCHINNEEKKKEILQIVGKMSERGLRVLGVARALFVGENLPNDQHDFEFEFAGLLGFVDPVRPSAPGAVQEAYEAGMRVIMITGDYPGTAQFIAEKIGIRESEKFLTGRDLEKMSDLELREKIKTVNIFARIVPEQKLQIVNALKANDEVVAMTGDGVNDAPALKSANIGIAMGERGTDVAREASSLVLLNDDFSSIVASVRLGRRIYENLKRAMGYLLAVHVPIAGMSVLPLVFGMPPVLLPAHVAFLELIIDPACSTVFESVKEERGIMKRPPRALRQSLFGRRMVSISLIQGLVVLLGTFVLFYLTIKSGGSESEARSVAFASLVLSNLMLITVNLSWDKNIDRILLSAGKIFYFVVGGAILSLMAVLYVPTMADLFHLAPLSLRNLVLVVLVVLASIIWFEALKFIKLNRLKMS